MNNDPTDGIYNGLRYRHFAEGNVECVLPSGNIVKFKSFNEFQRYEAGGNFDKEAIKARTETTKVLVGNKFRMKNTASISIGVNVVLSEGSTLNLVLPSDAIFNLSTGPTTEAVVAICSPDDIF
jgi:hypothetical protein